MEFQLTNNQQQIFDAIEKTNDNILVHGKPGTGKSVLINSIMEKSQKSFTLCAPTGLAAININGKTLHSVFQIPVSSGMITPEFAQYQRIHEDAEQFLKYGVKRLIIDEISMVRGDQFDFVSELLKRIKGDTRAFGGIQVILVGDFFQLPPIVNKAELKEFKEHGYESQFVFDSKAFAEGNFKTMELTEVLRQKGDNEFIELLHSARSGEVTPKQMVLLNSRVESNNDLRIKLVSTNKESDAINQRELSKIDSKPQIYQASKYGHWPALPADERLELKIGAQVIVKRNNADRPLTAMRGKWESKVVNGSLGIVVEMEPHTTDETSQEVIPGWVVIETLKKQKVKIYPQRWERKIKERNEETGKWEERLVASFEQIPLSLAWAISMHKSQGQSFEQVHIDASKVFAAGQLYVALSRARSLKGLTLESRVNKDRFWTDKNVLRFESTIKK